MFNVALDAATLAGVQMHASPAFEAIEWLRYAAVDRPHPSAGPTGPRAAAALRHPDVALVSAVLPGRGSQGFPDLLTPEYDPAQPKQALRHQLEALAATDPDEVARQLQEVFGATPPPPQVRDAIEAGTFGARAANGLWRFWRATLADDWTALETVLENDISRRCELAGRRGVGALLDSMHPDVRWDDGRLRVDRPGYVDLSFTGGRLVLVPTVLGWPLFFKQFARPRAGVLMYPAQGTPSPAAPRPATPGLVGRSRAALLADLGTPRSTGELSRRHTLAPATVSYHLGVLLRAGMVTRFRDGLLVYYRRTGAGEALLGARPDGAFPAG
ncbi:DUF5937 family protein [Micromonospora mirobrigensis]|uniref:Helix-turn-helix domain-containing protein n=1 Tax=Micromonospora mirobrigensis TaxID=262898 RepID=A0A1C4U1W5_9ACTN|nr:DUF5937 family protein [Micromonospora mirobrigensis]SCE65624.1 Helix-turn-helix domain-containing protein [Micromonospora mirobrigensis]